MPTEIIQQVYDYLCLYKKALRAVIVQFFFAVITRRTTKRDNKKNSIKSFKKTLSKPWSHSLPLKIGTKELTLN